MSEFLLISRNEFDQLVRKLDQVLSTLEGNQHGFKSVDDWISEKEAQKLTGLKTTSLWALRKQKRIMYSKIGRKTFYSLRSIKKLLDKNQD